MIHLEVHSHYSMGAGTASPRQLVARAVEHGMTALALTDTDGLYGVVPFYRAAREAGVKPLIGARLGSCVVLARDREGYAQLCALVTAIHLNGLDRTRPAAWAAVGLDLSRLFLMSDEVRVLESLCRAGLEPLAAVVHYGGPTSHRRAEAMMAQARRLGIPPVAVAPVWFLDPPHHAIHRVLSAIRHNTVVDLLQPGETAPESAFFRSARDLERLFAHWPETLDNAVWVAEECTLDLPLGRPLFPQIPLPPGETPFSWLWKQSFEGLKNRYKPLSANIIDRVHRELRVIDDLGFAPYFLIVSDIVRYAKDLDIPIVSRGSAGNSLVAYALGISRVDPIKYSLYFERFLNPGRSDCPDIDLDICWRRRDEVIDYVYRTYGADRVAMIATMNTFRARSSVREVAKATGMTDREIQHITRVLPHYKAGDIRAMAAQIPECRDIRSDREPLKSILSTCEIIDGFPRYLSIHAGGVLIAPEPITRFVPLQRANKGIVITQYDMHPIEALGLVKMDLLGHRSLSVLHDSVAFIEENRGVKVDLEAIPDPDPDTAALLREGRTVGCFQVESPAMRGLLRKVGAETAQSVIQCVALVRPGASGSGMKQHFIDRCHGREPVTYLHPTLESVLGDTYGVMIYQEDVLKVAHVVAGLDLGEADALRRAMSKKRGPREMAKHLKHFVERAVERGVAEETARQIWELIANFAAYAYCKAHAATYGELAYQSAWLKAHYPAEFFAAVLANHGGFYASSTYLAEAKRCGVRMLNIAINRSKKTYSAEYDGVRMGLHGVKGVDFAVLDRIQAARKEGPFDCLSDVIYRARLGRSDAEALCAVGAFDFLSDNSGYPLPRSMCQRQLHSHYETGDGTMQTNIFQQKEGFKSVLSGPDYTFREVCDHDWAGLDLLPRTWPLHYVLADLTERPVTPSTFMPVCIGQHISLTGWPITDRRLNVKDGTGFMKFLTMDDGWGVYEAVLFPEVYRTHGQVLAWPGPYRLTGEVQSDRGHTVLLVDTVETLAGISSRQG